MRDFNHTVNVLVKAYLDNTLRHGNCSACAVGNIVGGPEWSALFITMDEKCQLVAGEDEICAEWRFRKGIYKLSQLPESTVAKAKEILTAAREMVKLSGYSIQELMRIEFAFETSDKGNNDDEWMFNGLMAVVDQLAIIHNVDLTQKESAKKLFVKA